MSKGNEQMQSPGGNQGAFSGEQSLLWRPEGRLGWLAEGEIPELWKKQLADASKVSDVLIDLREAVGIDRGGLNMIVKLVIGTRRAGVGNVVVAANAPRVVAMLKLVQLDLICNLLVGGAASEAGS